MDLQVFWPLRIFATFSSPVRAMLRQGYRLVDERVINALVVLAPRLHPVAYGQHKATVFHVTEEASQGQALGIALGNKEPDVQVQEQRLVPAALEKNLRYALGPVRNFHVEKGNWLWELLMNQLGQYIFSTPRRLVQLGTGS